MADKSLDFSPTHSVGTPPVPGRRCYLTRRGSHCPPMRPDKAATAALRRVSNRQRNQPYARSHWNIVECGEPEECCPFNALRVRQCRSAQWTSSARLHAANSEQAIQMFRHSDIDETATTPRPEGSRDLRTSNPRAQPSGAPVCRRALSRRGSARPRQAPCLGAIPDIAGGGAECRICPPACWRAKFSCRTTARAIRSEPLHDKRIEASHR